MQFQNPAERWIGYLSRRVMILLEKSGAPPKEWWSALLYAIYVHNRTANRNLGWRTPIEVKTGETPDISDINQFAFYQLVQYKSEPSKNNFPLPRMATGRYLRPAQNTGGVFASVIRAQNGQLIYRSQLRAIATEQPPLSQAEQGELLRSRSNLFDTEVLSRVTPIEKDGKTSSETIDGDENHNADSEEEGALATENEDS
jgi:hypothetical protein